jgi:hypothetical protein
LLEFQLEDVGFGSSAGLGEERLTNENRHSSVIFEKPTVAFEAQNLCVKSPTVQVEFEAKRNSTTTLLAVAKASIASGRSGSDGDGEMR